MSVPTRPAADRYSWIRHAVELGTLQHQMVPSSELRQLWAEHQRTERWVTAVTAAVAGAGDDLEQLLAGAEPHVLEEVLAAAEAVSAAAIHEIVRRHAAEASGCHATCDPGLPCPHASADIAGDLDDTEEDL